MSKISQVRHLRCLLFIILIYLFCLLHCNLCLSSGSFCCIQSLYIFIRRICLPCGKFHLICSVCLIIGTLCLVILRIQLGKFLLVLWQGFCLICIKRRLIFALNFLLFLRLGLGFCLRFLLLCLCLGCCLCGRLSCCFPLSRSCCRRNLRLQRRHISFLILYLLLKFLNILFRIFLLLLCFIRFIPGVFRIIFR